MQSVGLVRFFAATVTMVALSASASSVWDLVSSSSRPRKASRAPSVLERGYVPSQKAESAATNVVADVEQKPAEVKKGSDQPAEGLLGDLAEVSSGDVQVVADEKPVANAVEVGKPVEVECIVTVEKPVTNTVEVVKVETVEVEKPVTNFVEKIVEVEKPVEVERIVTVEKPVTNTVEVVKVETVEVEKPVTNFVEKIVEVEKPVEKIVERHVTNVVEKIVEVEKPVVVERTNVVEKVVVDRAVEMRLAKDKAELERRGGALEARNAGLEKRNDELRRELDAERSRRERLERVQSGGKKQSKTGRPACITSKTTYYDRKKGVAFFEGDVYVDDESYQLHADKAYVFAHGSNDVRRIVAVGNVAMTNETRRAYGGKVSYYRQDGMVVLYAGDGIDAEIRDESKEEDQSVRGRKIKFWIDSEQVEVLDATISAPTSGIESGFNRRK